VVKLERGRDVSWLELIKLEMLPVLRLFWLGVEVATDWREVAGEEVTAGTHLPPLPLSADCTHAYDDGWWWKPHVGPGST